MTADLQPMAPAEAVELYLEGRKDDASPRTIEAHDYRLRAFVTWCEEEGIENLNELDGRDLYAYRVWRREGRYTADDEEGDELKTITLHGDLATVRAFLRFCGNIDAVPEELFTQVPLPSASGEDVSETTLDPDRAKEILDVLERFYFAQKEHVILLVLWHTGCRVGALRGLDLDDLDLKGERPNAEGPAVHFEHRPDTDTPLKNGESGERWNSINDSVAYVLKEYIAGHRHDVTDEYGREPLLTSRQGRVSRSNIRDTLYRITRPCWYSDECPHDKDPDTCEWTEYAHMSKCPSARSPHDVRSGRLTAYRLAEAPRPVVSDRMDASTEILEKHYDRRSERQKAEQRRDHLPDT